MEMKVVMNDFDIIFAKKNPSSVFILQKNLIFVQLIKLNFGWRSHIWLVANVECDFLRFDAVF